MKISDGQRLEIYELDMDVIPYNGKLGRGYKSCVRILIPFEDEETCEDVISELTGEKYIKPSIDWRRNVR